MRCTEVLEGFEAVTSGAKNFAAVVVALLLVEKDFHSSHRIGPRVVWSGARAVPREARLGVSEAMPDDY